MRILAIAAILAAAACSQRVTPEDEYAAREAARPAVPAPFAAPGAMPDPVAGAAPPEAAAPAASAADIAVTIEDPGRGPAGGVLFVFVRPAGAAGGPPLAVRRIAAPSFPMSLAIGPGDAMIAGTRFPDSVTVEARVDGDGVATTRDPGDRAARSDPVAPGGSVRLVLAPLGP